MIFNDAEATWDDDGLTLPVQATSALGVRPGEPVVCVAINGSGAIWPELVLSPFPPEMWVDLWRCEIDVVGNRATLGAVVSILHKLEVVVVSAETSWRDGGRNQTIALVLDCRRYSAHSDPPAWDRARMAECSLPALEAALAVDLIKDLLFSGAGRPRVRLRRLGAYHRARAEIVGNAICPPLVVSFKAEPWRLDAIDDWLKTVLGDRPFPGSKAVVVGESKDRIVRILLMHREPATLPLRFTLASDMEGVAMLLALLDTLGLYVVASRMRLHCGSISEVGLDVLVMGDLVRGGDEELLIARLRRRIEASVPLVMRRVCVILPPNGARGQI